MIDAARWSALQRRIQEERERAAHLAAGFTEARLQKHALRIDKNLHELGLAFLAEQDEHRTAVAENYWLDFAEFQVGLQIQALERVARVSRDLHCV